MVTIMPYLQMTMHFDFNIMLVAFTFTGILYVKAAAWFKRQNSSLRLGSFPEGHPVNGKMLCTSRSTFCLKQLTFVLCSFLFQKKSAVLVSTRGEFLDFIFNENEMAMVASYHEILIRLVY